MATSPTLMHPVSSGAKQVDPAAPELTADFRSFGTRVALVTMPFSYSKFPSIQLGTLSALVKISRTSGPKPTTSICNSPIRLACLSMKFCARSAGYLVNGCFRPSSFETTRNMFNTRRCSNRCLKIQLEKPAVRLAI